MTHIKNSIISSAKFIIKCVVITLSLMFFTYIAKLLEIPLEMFAMSASLMVWYTICFEKV